MKICAVVASRANYARVKHVLLELQKKPEFKLQLIAGASTLLQRFGRAVDIMKADGLTPDRVIHYIVEGETLNTQAKSTGLGIIELATALDNLKPDAVITVADRFETMATAIAATYMNIPLIHIQGGEISGNIDELVRHSITKLSSLHFPSTEESKDRVIKMGEDPSRVFNYGCPAMDILTTSDLSMDSSFQDRAKGTGQPFPIDQPYMLVVQHPVTTSFGSGFQQISTTLESLKSFESIHKVVLWPNIDAGTDDVSKGIRLFRQENAHLPYSYYINFSPEDYAMVLNNAVCCIGNSSSFIREGSFLGVPATLVGNRQEGRECGPNVQIVGHDNDKIISSVTSQLNHGRYEHSNLFGNGDASEQIVQSLSTFDFSSTKRMTY